jgi:hypothetical protein
MNEIGPHVLSDRRKPRSVGRRLSLSLCDQLIIARQSPLVTRESCTVARHRHWWCSATSKAPTPTPIRPQLNLAVAQRGVERRSIRTRIRLPLPVRNLFLYESFYGFHGWRVFLRAIASTRCESTEIPKPTFSLLARSGIARCVRIYASRHQSGLVGFDRAIHLRFGPVGLKLV